MNDSVLEKPLVLSLNRNWSALGYLTPKQALVAMCGGVYGGTPPALALDMEVDENGKLVYATAVTWDEWMKLPVREADLSLSTARGAIRCPMVIIRPGFAKQPLKTPRLSRQSIRERDNSRCQYTGEVIGPSDGNVDHVIPRDKGGKDEWDNLVWCKKDINFKKGNRLNHEVGLVLQKTPKAPKAVPVAVTLGSGKRPEHKPFLIR